MKINNKNLDNIGKWLKDNEEELLESYRFDISEAIKEDDDERLKDICSFEEYARGRWESELKDKEYEEERYCVKCGKTSDLIEDEDMCYTCAKERGRI